MAKYNIGDRIRVSAAFTDLNNANVAIDPTVVVFEWRIDGGTVVTFTYGTDAEIVKDSTGHYHVNIDPSIAGSYQYRWSGTGAAVAAEEGLFGVSIQRVV